MTEAYQEIDAAWAEVPWPGKPILSLSLAELLKDPRLTQPPAALEDRFAWRGRNTLLAGREKAGKSTLAAWIAARVSRRGERVLWLIIEGHTAELVQSLVRFGADTNNVQILDRLPEGLNSLAQEANAVRPALTILDTLPSLAEQLGSIKEHQGDSGGWTRLQNALGEIIRPIDSALIEITHAKKSDGTYRDSTAIGAGADMILEMREVESDPTLRTFRPRGRWHVPAFGMRLEGDTYRYDGGEVSLDAQILAFLRLNPGASRRGLRDGVGGRANEVDQAVKRLIAARVIVDQSSSATRCCFRLVDPSEIDGTRSGHALGHGGVSGANSLQDKGGTHSGTRLETPAPLLSREGAGHAKAGHTELEISQ